MQQTPNKLQLKNLKRKLRALEQLEQRFPFLQTPQTHDFRDFYALTDGGELDFEWSLENYEEKNNSLQALPGSLTRLPNGTFVQKIHAFYDMKADVFFFQCFDEKRKFIEEARKMVVQAPEVV